MTSPVSRKICDPPIEEACAEAVTSVSQLSLPLWIASTTRSKLIILVIDAGYSFADEFFSYKICPVS